MTQDWLGWTACDLGRGIAKAEIDPVELCDVFLEAIETHPFADKIYARVTPERARTEAASAALRARNNARLSLLDGVPVSWKDLFDTANIGTESGSALLKNRVPETDCQMVRNAGSAGLVCLGKTHMSEFAFSGLGINPMTQTPPCVNDHDVAPGGSSSGAAASVGFNLAAAGIGSDTGGSVRIPSAWNDLVGLKTTSGWLSLQGVVPLCPSFDTVGPLCRNVEDAAQLASVLSGYAVVDLKNADLKGRNFLVCSTVMLDEVDPEVREAFDRALAELTQAGATIVTAEIPEVAQALPLSPCLYTVEAYAQWREVIEANPELMYGEILQRFRIGGDFTGVDFVQAWNKLKTLRSQYLRRVAGFDAVLGATAPILPPNKARLEEDGEYYVRANLLALRNTRVGNLLGLCALSLPTSVPSCGLMVMGAPFEEAKILRLGAAMENVLSRS